MPLEIKPSCVLCAWRRDCKKQYSMVDPSRCQDFTLDVLIKDYPGKKGVKVLISGRPGCGKTTLVERLLVRLKDVKAGGFFTREIRDKGERKGFRIITLDKREGVLAHVDLKGGITVGKYVVNLEDLEGVGVDSIVRALKDCDLVVIDEIGKMELMSNRFREVVEIAVRGDKQLVATVPSEGVPFVEELKKMEGVHVITLTEGNRDQAVEEVARHLSGDIP